VKAEPRSGRKTGTVSDWEGSGPKRRIFLRWVVITAAVLMLVGVAMYVSRRGGGLPVVTVEDEEGAIQPAPGGCPQTNPVAVNDDSRVYYPVAYPHGGGLSVHGCYDTARSAAADGYRLADPPPGARVVEGIYLEATRSPSDHDCRELAAVVGYTIPCPRRLPAPADGPPCGERLCTYPGPDRLVSRRPLGSRGVVIQHGFTIPPEPPWSGSPHDLVITAVEVAGRPGDPTPRILGPRELVSCFPEGEVQPRGETTFRTCVDARPFVPGYGGHPLERHTAAVWRRGNVVYAAGIEGAGNHVDALLAAVIADIKYVAPP
jgi:hypothetical protein